MSPGHPRAEVRLSFQDRQYSYARVNPFKPKFSRAPSIVRPSRMLSLCKINPYGVRVGSKSNTACNACFMLLVIVVVLYFVQFLYALLVKFIDVWPQIRKYVLIIAFGVCAYDFDL